MPNENDDAYTRATKAVVDDTMRIDVLGPYIVKVLKEHSPTSAQIKTMMIDAVKNDTKVRTALKGFLSDVSITKKGEGLTQFQQLAITVGITVVVTLAVTAGVNALVQTVNKQPTQAQQTSQTK